MFKDRKAVSEELRCLRSYRAYDSADLGVLFNRSMSKNNFKRILIAGLLALIAVPISFQLLRLQGMFQLHTYNWRTGMPSLQDQVTAFRKANNRWPKDYEDLVAFMKQSVTNFVPESYDRIDFTTKTDGNLEIDVYVFSSGTTNHINLNAPGNN